MFMLVGSTAMSTIIVTLIIRRRCFGKSEELVVTAE
jgi:putative ABC transport system permease protein